MQKISICIATCNGAKFIGRQLDSIMPQLDYNDEIIISDDSSEDETVKIIASYNDKRIKIFSNQKFRNTALNFGNAISKASGSIIFLCDQDDVWMDDKVQKTLILLKTYDLVVSDCVVVNDQLQTIHDSFFKFRGSKEGFWNNLKKNSYLGCCMAFKAKYIDYILPIPKELIFEHDWWIGLVIQLFGKTYFYEHPLIYYVRHGKNASLTATGKSYSIFKKIRNRYFLLKNVLLRIMRIYSSVLGRSFIIKKKVLKNV